MTALSLIAVVFTTLAIMNEGSPICQDPQHIVNKDYNINTQDVTNMVIPDEYIKIRRLRVAGDASCKVDGNRYGNQPDCPVYYVLNTDINRIPRHKYEQICSCSNPPTSERGVSLVECIPVFTEVPVQRRFGCEDGFYNYTLTLEKFQTGCVSKQPPIRYVPSDTPKSPAK